MVGYDTDMNDRELLRFAITDDFSADCVKSDQSRAGEIYHVSRNNAGGAMLTPIDRYFVWRPIFIEGFHDHWRVDCIIRVHPRAPKKPMPFGKSLIEAHEREGLCDRPIWLSLYSGQEIDGQPFGEVFDYDD